MMEHVNKEEVYNLFDRALDAAKEPFFRNNIRLMRMVFRYSDLEISFRNEYNPEGLYAGIYSDTVDDKGELWYIKEHFDIFISNQEGVGAAFPLKKEKKGFCVNKYYNFE